MQNLDNFKNDKMISIRFQGKPFSITVIQVYAPNTNAKEAEVQWPFKINTAAAAKSLQSCPTLCDPTDGSLPGFPVPGILQARTLEWVAISVSNVWKWKVKVKLLSHVWLLATPRTAAYQAPLTMGFSRQEYWSGLPLPSLNFKNEGTINQLYFN